jgi:hypothetical protein
MNTTADRVQAKFYITKQFGAMVGKTIHAIRPCAQQIVDDFGWHAAAIEIVFTDGSSALITSDEEGNGPGWMLTAGI